MNPAMFGKMGFLIRSVRTQLTRVLFLSGVNVHVSLQIVLSRKRFVALSTWIRSFTSVGSEVAGQIVGFFRTKGAAHKTAVVHLLNL